MSTLKEEREAIVDMIDDIMAKYHMGEHMYSPEREEIVATILSYEEKVMERVRKDVEDYFDIRLEDLVNEHLLNEDPHTETRIFEAKKNRDEILTITNEDNLK